MVSKLALRGQAGVGVAAFMHEEGVRYGGALESSCDAERIIDAQQDPNFRPHVAIAQIHNRRRAITDGDDLHYNASTSRNLAISVDGALVNARELREELLAQGYKLNGDTDAELLLKWIESSCERDYWRHGLPVDYENVFRDIDDRIDGGISALLLDGEGNLVAYRSRSGLRPLEFMQTDDGFSLFASENCAFVGLEGKMQQLLPGHIKYVDGKTGDCADRSVVVGRYKAKLCAYEALYLGNPNTSIEGQSHRETRYKIGVALAGLVAKRLGGTPGSALTIVSSMPHTGGPYADGLFASLAEYGVFVQRQEIVATQFLQRTLIGAPGKRKARIARKYRVPQQTRLAESTIVMVDEALIRGDTSQAVTNMLLAAGAKAVHWAIGSPPIVAPNYYGMGIDTLEELAFWRIWKRLPPEQRKQSLSFHKMEPQLIRIIECNIAAFINAATITYLPFQLLEAILPRGRDGFDLSPFTFEMPTPAGQKRADRNLHELTAHLSSLVAIPA
ncbi:glutamine phosphoribosylpyrophosphate amidotransferase [Bradyrhizobium sacchari]|uniref:Glutamine phosphoribosylpyrophosphate amidotransferase n=2 Tax=Bradyrhizobium sacchari TaxID=1399419 RepID=A0A560KFY9_9BRAD|nr:glutamine phosphoribosylpyrophosphate amidotransferase [Bradyrhizobium sacchari]TWB80854.1 glutamine phosphoribosylpyrophosphate amidotransferase [Bradyrhizobium sacchari]